MRKTMARLLLPILATTMLSVAIPATASAASLSYENYDGVEEGTPVTLTGWATLDGGMMGDSHCESPLEMPYVDVQANGSGAIELEDWASPGWCTLSYPTFWWGQYLQGMKMVPLKSEGHEGTGTVMLAFTTTPEDAGGACEWEGLLPIEYSGGTNSFTVAGWMEAEDCGEMEFEAEFSIKNSQDERNVLLNREPVVPAFIAGASGTSTVSLSSEGLIFNSGKVTESECSEITGSSSLNEMSYKLSFGTLGSWECGNAQGGPLRMNGCSLTLHVSGSMDITCPPNKVIESEYGSSIEIIRPQSGLKGVSFESVTIGGKPAVVANIDVEALGSRKGVPSPFVVPVHAEALLSATNGGSPTALEIGLSG